MTISPETFGLTAGMKPHPEELIIKLCSDRLTSIFHNDESLAMFIPGSPEYGEPQ
jgi:hypothetical protein